jgi:uncharacterized protein YdbL (DUF1318 family)
MSTNETAGRRHVVDLVRLLEDLRGSHEQLLSLIERKTAAMKQANLETMRSLGVAEQEVAARIRERNGLRRQLMESIAAHIGVSRANARVMTASQLAARLPEGEGQPLLDAARALSETMTRVGKVNRMARLISGRILAHLKAVFQAITTPDEKADGYSDAGGPVTRTDAVLFETVG